MDKIPSYLALLFVIPVILTACASSPLASPNPSPSPLPFTSSPLLTPPPPSPSPTRFAPPSPTPSPSPAPPSPTPTPLLRQLTNGGCCVQPGFSPDGRQVLFIDKPNAAAPSGIYGVDLYSPQPTPVLVNKVIGFRNWDRTIVATIQGELSYFSNETTGKNWTVNTGGNWPRFSPDSGQILWVAADEEGPYDRRQSDVWLANLDGTNPHLLLTLYGGGFEGWFPDSQRLLFIGRDDPDEEKQTLFVYDLVHERRLDLFSHKRLRGGEISAGGSWISFLITFAEEPAENGLWVISADGQRQRQMDLPRFGGYRWRDDETLLLIPIRSEGETSMRLWAIDAPSGQIQPLTDPTSLSFSISNGDWDVSPDGRQVVFVNSADNNIWLITLP